MKENLECVFCHESGKSSHGVRMKKLNFELKCVCNDCFNEWISSLENSHYVNKVTEISDKIKKVIDAEFGGERK